MVMPKNEILFQNYLHGVILLYYYFIYIRFQKEYNNCYYVHYTVIMTKYIISFPHYYIHYTLKIKKTFSPIPNCCCVHYAVITKIP